MVGTQYATATVKTSKSNSFFQHKGQNKVQHLDQLTEVGKRKEGKKRKGKRKREEGEGRERGKTIIQQ